MSKSMPPHNPIPPELRSNGVSTNGLSHPLLLPEEEISIQDVLDILLKGKWIILLSFLLVISLVAAYTFSVAPEYEARSVLLIDTQQGGANLEDLLLLGAGNRSVANEVEILKSRQLAERVARRLLAIQVVPGTGKPLTVLSVSDSSVQQTPERVAKRLRSYVTISPVSKEVDMVQVKVVSTLPEEASLIANLYADEYIELNKEFSRARMSASREFLEAQEARVRADLQQAENRLQEFMEKEGVVALNEEATHLVEQIAALEAQRDQIRVELGTARAYLQTLKEEVDKIKPGLARRISVSSVYEGEISSIQKQIAELEVRIQEYYAKHPEVKGKEYQDRNLSELVQKLAQLRQRLHTLSEKYVSEVLATGGVEAIAGESGISAPLAYVSKLLRDISQKRIEINGYEAQLAAIDTRLQEYENRFEAIPRKTIQLARLQRAYAATEQLYKFLVEKLQEARIAEESELGYASIVDYAAVPEDPVSPRVILNLLLGMVLGLMLGVGIVFVRHALDTKIHRPEDLRKRGISVVGVVPAMEKMVKEDFGGKESVEVDGVRVSTRLVTLLNPNSPATEAYRRMRTNIQFSRPDDPVRSLLVTSPGPGEGKTVTAMNLAVVMARAGRKTVYLDADLRRPMGHQMIEVPREPGLVELLFEVVPFDIKNFSTPVDDLFLIPAGGSVPNPAELVGSRRMREFLKMLHDTFDVVIIDSPPVLAVTDALLLAPHSDGTIVVVSANETDWHALERSKEMLEEVRAYLLGAVLNRFDARTAYGYYAYYNRYGYYYDAYYYGEEKQEKKPRLFKL